MKPILKPTYKQHLAWEALTKDDSVRYIVFGGGAGGGKSWLGCEWLLTNCYFYPGSKWFIGRATLKSLMASTFVTFGKVCKKYDIPRTHWKINSKYNYIEFIAGAAKGSRIDLLDCAYKPSDQLFEGVGSLEFTGGWLEEAGEISFNAFDTLKSRIGRHMNEEYNLTPKMLITCNPKKNWLYKYVYRPFRDDTLPSEFVFIQSLFGDNPHTAKTYAQQLADIRDPAAKQRLMYGNWEYDDDPNALMNYEAIVDIFTNTVDWSEEKYITVDVARFGKDRSVLFVWRGLEVIDIEIIEKADTARVTTHVKNKAVAHQVPYSHIAIDEIGIGAGVVDNMMGVKGIVGNTSPMENPIQKEKENFNHLRDQLYYKLAEQINLHKISIREGALSPEEQESLTAELEYIRGKDIQKSQKLRVIPKEDIRTLLKRSPDLADTLMLRMIFFYEEGSDYMDMDDDDERNTHQDLNSPI